ncbi:MAG: 23S rRNA (cytosine1962-C5)-methyltransferase [Candidatus Poriferisodalaceae bacterium]
MFESSEYELVDFGAGRKLERFGAQLLDRRSPAADGVAIADPGLWGSTTARFDLAQSGKGQWNKGLPPWSVAHGDIQLIMQLAESGNVGTFPEQAGNWDWIAEQVTHCQNSLPSRRPRVLNLFAYTGGASLAAAIAGAEVTHVDSSGPTVAWAKRNAEASGLADAPIRWLVEDAMKFVARECRRGNYYDGIIADPPTYGHGPKGRPFKFRQHLGVLMESCAELLAGPTDRFLLFSCHAPGFGPTDATSAVSSVLPDSGGARVTGLPLVLESRDGRRLDAGVAARWSAQVA